MRLAAWACTFVIGCTLFFIPQETNAEGLTDKEVEHFRTHLQEGKVEPTLPGPLTDKEMTKLLERFAIFKGITFGGYLTNYVQYESVNPRAGDSVAIPPKYFARQVKSFTVNNMQIWLYKKVPRPGDVGFKMVLDWGETARRLTGVGPVRDDSAVQPNPPGAPNGARQTTFKEAYVQWNVPIGTGLTVQFWQVCQLAGVRVVGDDMESQLLRLLHRLLALPRQRHRCEA